MHQTDVYLHRDTYDGDIGKKKNDTMDQVIQSYHFKLLELETNYNLKKLK